MTRSLPIINAEDARILLLQAQGLLHDPSRAATPATVEKLIRQLGFVQIDSINVVERAHHLTLGSRLDGYRPALLQRLLEDRRSLFEHWTHDASAIPTEWFPHWKPRFSRHHERVQRSAWWRERMGVNAEKMIDSVRQRIEREGPLQSRDFETDQKRQGDGSWWGWKPDKAALEYLWRSGVLAIARRVNFQKVYDLTERVFPDHAKLPAPDREEHIHWACSAALERLGVATPAELAAYWHAIDLQEARMWCEESARRGEIERVMVVPLGEEKPKPSFAVRDWRKRVANAQSPPDRMRLLSPFDPVLRDRRRALRLFAFDYRFEAFVPAPKRRYGYYVLPILYRDQLIGRADAKFQRESGTLTLRVWWEPRHRPRLALLEEAAERLAKQIGAESATIDVMGR